MKKRTIMPIVLAALLTIVATAPARTIEFSGYQWELPLIHLHPDVVGNRERLLLQVRNSRLSHGVCGIDWPHGKSHRALHCDFGHL